MVLPKSIRLLKARRKRGKAVLINASNYMAVLASAEKLRGLRS